VVLAVPAFAIVAVRLLREPVLQAAGWALVANEKGASATPSSCRSVLMLQKRSKRQISCKAGFQSEMKFLTTHTLSGYRLWLERRGDYDGVSPWPRDSGGTDAQRALTSDEVRRRVTGPAKGPLWEFMEAVRLPIAQFPAASSAPTRRGLPARGSRAASRAVFAS